jgi:hypothetical protein
VVRSWQPLGGSTSAWTRPLITSCRSLKNPHPLHLVAVGTNVFHETPLTRQDAITVKLGSARAARPSNQRSAWLTVLSSTTAAREQG